MRPVALVIVATSSLLAIAEPSASCQSTARVSVSSSGTEGNGWSTEASLSANGRFVALTSWADNLVQVDTNAAGDIFVFDRATGEIALASVATDGTQGDYESSSPSISADGRVVCFASGASTFISGGGNGQWNVFAHDVTTGVTETVDVDSSGALGPYASWGPSTSADGRFVAFVSTNGLASEDTNGAPDVYVRDRLLGITELVSVASDGTQGDGYCDLPSISADGRFVAFESTSTNLVSNDLNGVIDVFVRDRQLGTTSRVSVASDGSEGNDYSYYAAMSGDGSSVAFASRASNFDASDSDAFEDVYVHSMATGETLRVSVDASGNSGGSRPAISFDGSTVAFLGPPAYGPGQSSWGIFARSMASPDVHLVSADSSGTPALGGSWGASINADGTVVAFFSEAANLVAADNNGQRDVFVRSDAPASWSNYGSGLAGTNGVPSFVARSVPMLDATLTLDLGNSSSSYSVALVLLGYLQGQFHSAWGGDLLLVPSLGFLVPLSPAGTSMSGDLPNDPALIGVEVDLQAFEVDSGAPKGVSITRGLQLVLGR